MNSLLVSEYLKQKNFTEAQSAVAIGRILNVSKTYDNKYRSTTKLDFAFNRREDGKEYLGEVACWSRILGSACPTESIDNLNQTIKIQYMIADPGIYRVYRQDTAQELQAIFIRFRAIFFCISFNYINQCFSFVQELIEGLYIC